MTVIVGSKVTLRVPGINAQPWGYHIYKDVIGEVTRIKNRTYFVSWGEVGISWAYSLKDLKPLNRRLGEITEGIVL